MTLTPPDLVGDRRFVDHELVPRRAAGVHAGRHYQSAIDRQPALIAPQRLGDQRRRGQVGVHGRDAWTPVPASASAAMVFQFVCRVRYVGRKRQRCGSCSRTGGRITGRIVAMIRANVRNNPAHPHNFELCIAPSSQRPRLQRDAQSVVPSRTGPAKSCATSWRICSSISSGFWRWWVSTSVPTFASAAMLSHGVGTGQCVVGQSPRLRRDDLAAGEIAAVHQDVGIRRQTAQAGAIDGVATERDHAVGAFEPVAETYPALAKRIGKAEPVAVVHDLGGDPPAGALADRAREDVGRLRRVATARCPLRGRGIRCPCRRPDAAASRRCVGFPAARTGAVAGSVPSARTTG